MWWSNKKEAKEESVELPRLPSLPDIKFPYPKITEIEDSQNELHQLPSFPINKLGEKFSQSTIKNAVEGAEEIEEKEGNQPPAKLFSSNPYKNEIPKEFSEASKKIKETEPLFIRIDKFEESLRIFQDSMERITEIEELLKETKEIKEKEEKELETWENEIRTIKEQIDKVDKNIFSRI